MEPTIKAPEIEAMLKNLTGRSRVTSIKELICSYCGQAGVTFRDALSAKEYSISGLCQKCQDKNMGSIKMNKQTALEILEAFQPEHLIKEAVSLWFNDQYEAIKIAEEALKNEETLEDQITELQDIADQLEEKLYDAKQEIKDLEQEITDLNEVIEDREYTIAKLKDEIKYLNNKLEATNE